MLLNNKSLIEMVKLKIWKREYTWMRKVKWLSKKLLKMQMVTK